uniref:Uncharacterized protein n=1 Tax=Arundo donax TaxID=35708 RepID=A0A0A9HDY0_ARUDO
MVQKGCQGLKKTKIGRSNMAHMKFQCINFKCSFC